MDLLKDIGLQWAAAVIVCAPLVFIGLVAWARTRPNEEEDEWDDGMMDDADDWEDDDVVTTAAPSRQDASRQG